ncbi:hypothetical protein PINS_up008800 [Pythium insidiosum]|nr:hypothetical protein PINS_up008800 [Pythium insidiosum]
MTTATVSATDDHEVHPYYTLLPSYITPERVARERDEFIGRVQETLTTLQRLRDGEQGAVLQKRHFRVIETTYKLKHALPKTLHAALIRELVAHLWEQRGAKLLDVDMELRAVKTLQMLLKKWRHKRRPEEQSEIALDWRLAKEAVDRVCFATPGHVRIASQVTLQALASATIKCVESARPFFPSSGSIVVSELWQEFADGIKKTSLTHCFKSLGYITLLCPVGGTDAEWEVISSLLPEWFAAWSSISRCSDWDGHWLKLLSRVAKRFPIRASAAMEPYLAFVFGKVHDLLELPSDLGAPFKNKSWPTAYSILHGSKRFDQYSMRLCVYLLADPHVATGEPATANQFVQEIISTVKMLFHPSNASNAANSLGVTVYYLVTMLARRLGHEKAHTPKLHISSCRPIFDALLELCFYGIYSKSRSVASKCMYVLKTLVCVDPEHCAKPVLDEMVKALDPHALSQSHMAPAAISSMSVFLYHLMCGQHPKGTGLLFSTYLAPLLRLTLPGIDPNDEKKTVSTVAFYFHVLEWLPLVNDVAKKSSDNGSKSRGAKSFEIFSEMKSCVFAEMTPYDAELDSKLWELGSFLEEWSLALLGRCLDFIRTRTSSHSGHADAPSKHDGGHRGSSKSGEDQAVLEVINMMGLLYSQMSPSIFNQALKMTVSFVSNSFFTSTFGGKVVSQLVSACVHTHITEAVPAFMRLVVDKMGAAKSHTDLSHLMPNESIWLLRILSGVVQYNDGSALLAYREQLESILNHFLRDGEEKEVQDAAGAVLQHLLNALLNVYPLDFRSLSPSNWSMATSESSSMFQFLGTAVAWKDLQPAWHEPNEQEAEFGYQLLLNHMVTACSEMARFRKSKEVGVRPWLRALKCLYESVRGSRNVLVDRVSGEGTLQAGALPLLTKACGENSTLFNQFVQLKANVVAEVLEAVSFWSANITKGANENQVWHILLKTIKQLLVWRGSHLEGHRSKEKQNTYIKATTCDVASKQLRKSRRYEDPLGEQTPLASRNEMLERVLFFYSKRKVQEHFELSYYIFSNESGASTTKQQYEMLLNSVEQLMQSPYEEVRSNAASVMRESTDIFAKWVYSRVSHMLDILEGRVTDPTGVVKEEVISGAIEFMTKPLVLNHFWRIRGRLLERALLCSLQIDDLVLKKMENEAGKTRVGLLFQTFFLSVLASWRFVKGDDAGTIMQLLSAEPSVATHWKHQLMHLVAFYPFLQLDGAPLPVDLFKLVIRKLSHEVLPVRQIAVLLFSQLVRIHEYSKYPQGPTEEVNALIFSPETVKSVLQTFLENHRNSHRFSASADGQHANSAPSDWSFGVNEVIRYLSNTSNSYPKPEPLSPVRMLPQRVDAFKDVNLVHLKLIERLVKINPLAVLDEQNIRIVRDLVESISPKQSDEDKQACLATVAEWIGGCTRGLMRYGDNDKAGIWIDSAADLLRKALSHVNAAIVEPWALLLYYVSRPSTRQDQATALALDRLAPMVNFC